MEWEAAMTKRERRMHDTVHQDQAAQATKQTVALLSLGIIAIVLVLAGAAVLLIQSPWMMAHRMQVVGALGLALFAMLLALPIVVEFNRHPRHLSGPGKNPEQGPGPWDLGGR
jgi:FtsH-binding integral membrane protein